MARPSKRQLADRKRTQGQERRERRLLEQFERAEAAALADAGIVACDGCGLETVSSDIAGVAFRPGYGGVDLDDFVQRPCLACGGEVGSWVRGCR